MKKKKLYQLMELSDTYFGSFEMIPIGHNRLVVHAKQFLEFIGYESDKSIRSALKNVPVDLKTSVYRKELKDITHCITVITTENHNNILSFDYNCNTREFNEHGEMFMLDSAAINCIHHSIKWKDHALDDYMMRTVLPLLFRIQKIRV